MSNSTRGVFVKRTLYELYYLGVMVLSFALALSSFNVNLIGFLRETFGAEMAHAVMGGLFLLCAFSIFYLYHKRERGSNGWTMTVLWMIIFTVAGFGTLVQLAE